MLLLRICCRTGRSKTGHSNIAKTIQNLPFKNTDSEKQRLGQDLINTKARCRILDRELSKIVKERDPKVNELEEFMKSLEHKAIKAEEELDSLRFAYELISGNKQDISPTFRKKGEQKDPTKWNTPKSQLKETSAFEHADIGYQDGPTGDKSSNNISNAANNDIFVEVDRPG